MTIMSLIIVVPVIIVVLAIIPTFYLLCERLDRPQRNCAFCGNIFRIRRVYDEILCCSCQRDFDRAVKREYQKSSPIKYTCCKCGGTGRSKKYACVVCSGNGFILESDGLVFDRAVKKTTQKFFEK